MGFYFLYWLSLPENNLASTDGFLIVNILGPLFIPFHLGRSLKSKELLQNGSPIKIKQLFIVHVPDEGVDSNGFLVKLLPIGIRFASSLTRGDELVVPVFGNSRQEVLNQLIRLGFNKDCLPPKLGGTWSYKLWELFLARQGLPPRPSQTETTPTTPAAAHSLQQPQHPQLQSPKLQVQQYASPKRSVPSTEVLSSMTRNHNQQHQHLPNNNNNNDPAVVTGEEGDRKMSPANRSQGSFSTKGGSDTGTGTTSRKRNMTSMTTKAASAADIHCCSPEQLEEALETIPSPEKAAFVEAQKRVPFLVETESPMKRFFVSTDFDPNIAARRLAAYWDIRKELYGDRAFLPLTLTGSNALTNEDLAALDKGLIIVLPDDSSGHPVIALDFSILDHNKGMVSERSIMRMLFYVMQVSAEKEISRNKGMVVLVILPQNTQSYRPPNDMDVIIQVMPVKLNMIYLMGIAPDSSRRSLLKPVIQSTLNALNSFAADKAVIHVVETKKQLRTRFEVLGFCPSGLPISVGGKWHLTAELPKWKSQQIAIEQDRINCAMAMKHAGGVYGDDDSDPEDEGDTEEGCNESFHHSKTGVCGDGDCSEGTAENEMVPSAISVGQSDVKETAAMISKGLSELEEAIELLPEEEKAALLEARECIPEIAQKEAPPIRFLRFEGYNTWDAAKRLAAYWSARKSVFDDRAFLPLNQSGEGALTRDEVTSFNSGYFCPLPYDEKGRSVICYDISRIADYSKEVRLRISFYLFSVISENERSQREGSSVIVILRTVQKDNVAQGGIEVITAALPVRFKAIYMVNSPADSEKTTFSQSFLPIMMRVLGLLSKRSIVVVADTKVQVAEKLAKYDFAIDSLPECIGGTWSYEQFSRWQELRTRYEWDLPAVGKREKDIPHVPDYKVKLRSQLTEVEKIERKRRLNVLNSRRKRERVRVEVSVFCDQAKTLQKRNRLLKEDNKRLEILLVAAVKEIEKVEQQSESRSGLVSEWNTALSQSRVADRFIRERDYLNGIKGPPLVGDGKRSIYSPEIMNDRQIADQLMRAQRSSSCTTTFTPVQRNPSSFSSNVNIRPVSGNLSLLSQQQQHQQQMILPNHDSDSQLKFNAAASLAAQGRVSNRIDFLIQQSQPNHIPSDFQFGMPWGALFSSTNNQQQEQQQSGLKNANEAAPKRSTNK